MKHLLIKISLLLILMGTAFCSDPEDPKDKLIESYFSENMINDYRSDKDNNFKTGEHSPLTDSLLKSFGGLLYYRPDISFACPAMLKPFPNPDTVTMLTSKENQTRTMLHYGRFFFEYKDSIYSLSAYVILPDETGQRSFFLPFTDPTNGTGTYEAGRYLDIAEIPGSKVYILDFNFAYNPYCAYNDKYSCPLVPMQNHLPFEVKAGEKTYKKPK